MAKPTATAMAFTVADDAKIQKRLAARLERWPNLNGILTTLIPLDLVNSYESCEQQIRPRLELKSTLVLQKATNLAVTAKKGNIGARWTERRIWRDQLS
jgi:hypothetical protein